MKVYFSERMAVNGPLNETISISFKIDKKDVDSDLPDKMAQHLKDTGLIDKLQELLREASATKLTFVRTHKGYHQFTGPDRRLAYFPESCAPDGSKLKVLVHKS